MSAMHQLSLLVLAGGVALLEVVPLELQRRIVDDLVKHRPYSWVIWLCAAYAGVVLVQGGTKLALNVYRSWVGERAKRDLRRRVHSIIEAPSVASPAAEEYHLPVRRSGQMPAADHVGIEMRALGDVTHGYAEMGNGSDPNHLTIPE